jgi:hypothetical protein
LFFLPSSFSSSFFAGWLTFTGRDVGVGQHIQTKLDERNPIKGNAAAKGSPWKKGM